MAGKNISSSLAEIYVEALVAQAGEALAQHSLPPLRTPAPRSTNFERGGLDESDDKSDVEGDDA